MTIPSPQLNPPLPTTPMVKPASQSESVGLWEGQEVSFADVLDMVNPLQHLPVVSTIYRENTGDEMGAVARLLGGVLFGGLLGSAVMGLASAAFNLLLKEESGQDAGEHLLALLDNGGEAGPENRLQSMELVANDLPSLAKPSDIESMDLPATWAQPQLATEQYRRMATLNPPPPAVVTHS